MLLSHVRGLDDARLLRRGLGEKAAADVEKLRNSELGSTLRDKAARDKALVRRRAERDKKLVSRGVGEVTDKALQDVENLRRLGQPQTSTPTPTPTPSPNP